jgi:predicted hydrocarbon binding protein
MPVSAGATGQSESTQEAIHWLTGKEFEVQKVECRAMGAPACVWEINKTPKQ